MRSVYNHLLLFTSHNLAMVSDWLDRTGGLSVYVSTLADQGIDLHYVIRSLHDLKALLWEYESWQKIAFTVMREPQFSLWGIADTDLLEQALQQFPDGHSFYVARFAPYPDECCPIEQGTTHTLLLQAFADEWSYPLAIAPRDPWITPQQRQDTAIVLDVRRNRDLSVKRTHEAYAPYDADPARYQWIVNMWQE